MVPQVCERKSRWNGSNLEAPSTTAVEVHLAQNVSHTSRVRPPVWSLCGAGKCVWWILFVFACWDLSRHKTLDSSVALIASYLYFVSVLNSWWKKKAFPNPK